MGRPRLTLEDMQKTAEACGGRCLSTEYLGAHRKLLWQCSEGHKWRTRPSAVRHGHWCTACGIKNAVKKRSLGIEDMQRRAEKRGGRCLSKRYINSITHLLWECAKGHRWKTTPQKVKRGAWCHVCGGIIKLTIEEMQEIAKARGGRCVSKTYKNSTSKLKWECAEGHRWEALPSFVKRGSWCPVCARKRKTKSPPRLSIEEMQKIAEARGGKCPSKIYKNVSSKLLWECSKGHQWEAMPMSIKSGTWCPVCAVQKRKLKPF